MELILKDLEARFYHGAPGERSRVKIENRQIQKDRDLDAAGVVVYLDEVEALARFLERVARRMSRRRRGGGPVVYTPSYSAYFNGHAGLIEAWPGQGGEPPHVRVYGLAVRREWYDDEEQRVEIAIDELPELLKALRGAAEALGIREEREVAR